VSGHQQETLGPWGVRIPGSTMTCPACRQVSVERCPKPAVDRWRCPRPVNPDGTFKK
jgi:hypothetical protein